MSSIPARAGVDFIHSVKKNSEGSWTVEVLTDVEDFCLCVIVTVILKILYLFVVTASEYQIN
jgi:hypothetical protein